MCQSVAKVKERHSHAVEADFNLVNALFQKNTLLQQMWAENKMMSAKSSGSGDLNSGRLNSVSNTSAQVQGRGLGLDDERKMFLFE